MSKQDRVYTRTASDLERKLNAKETFAKILGLATDAQLAADIAREAAEKAINSVGELDQEAIFNILTNNGENKGIYRENGEIYINASYIVSGQFIADLIKAGVLQSKDGKTFYLDLDNGVLKAQFTELSVSGKTVDAIAQDKADTAEQNAVVKASENATTIANNALAAQTQMDVFNKLTNNGAVQGIYLDENGNILINASYILSGILQGVKIIGEEGTIGGLTMSKNTLTATYRKDYSFTISDADACITIYQNWDSYTAAQQASYLALYDLNMNGRIDSGDATIIRNMVNGTTPTYSEGKITIDATNPVEAIRIEVTGGHRAGEVIKLGLGGLLGDNVVGKKVTAERFYCGTSGGYTGSVVVGDKTLTIKGGIITSVS